MSSEPDLDTLLHQLRDAQTSGASEEQLAGIRKQISAAGNREAAALQAARADGSLQNKSPGAKFAKVGPYTPRFTATPEILELQQKLRAAFDESDFAEYTDELIALAEPSIHLPIPKNSSESPKSSANSNATSLLAPAALVTSPTSRPASAWPTHDGKKMMFLAQIDFSQFPRWPGSPLPTDGWLYLFAHVFGVKKPNPWAHLFHYHQGPRESLIRQEEPVSPDEIWTDGHSLIHDLIPLNPAISMDIDRQYLELALPDLDPNEALEIVEETLRRDLHSAGYLLGQMDPFENTATGEINDILGGAHHISHENILRLASAPEGPGNDWIHMLSLRSVGSMFWGDCGVLYFLIRRSDLRAANFRNTVMSHLCA